MRIGLIGWYGHDNAGDERLLFALKRFFCDHDLFITSGFDDAIRKLDSLNKCDYILIGGGGLILRGFGKFASLIYDLTPKLGCVGISVEAVHPDNFALIEALKEKSEFIYVRDQNSKYLMENHPSVIVGPDLSFLYPYKPVQPNDREVCGLNLRSWHYAKVEYGSRIHHFIMSVDRRIPYFKRVYPFSKWQPRKFLTRLEKRFNNILPIPLYCENTRKNDVKELEQYFKNVPSSFSINLFRDVRYLVGMRLHSLIFASQLGIPFLSLSYQPKNIEFCKSIQLDCSIDLFDFRNLDVRLEHLHECYSDIRSHLLEFSDQQRKQAWKMMDSISIHILTP